MNSARAWDDSVRYIHILGDLLHDYVARSGSRTFRKYKLSLCDVAVTAVDRHFQFTRIRFSFLANVHVRYLLSPVRLSVVCNVRASYSGDSNFRQYFYGIRYLGHPLTSTENFTEIVPGEPLRRGS